MAEYIEREAALIICEKEYQERVKMQDWCGDTVAWNIGHAIKAIQIADVVPAVHGRWERCGRYLCECQNCGEIYSTHENLGKGWNYCPNCGAHMREAEGNG